jgi:2-oxoglutarate dehydrogenase E2 component (dihydrolipoamide succinyltransferase)
MGKTIEIRVPEDQQEGTRFVLQQWLQQAGDAVSAHQPVAELETDKVVMEIAAPADGVLQALHRQAGDELLAGELLATLELAGAAAQPVPSPGAAPPAGAASPPAVQAATGATAQAGRSSAAVRKMLDQLGLSAAQIKGTGKGGRVTARDVEAYLDRAGAAAPEPAPAAGHSHQLAHDSMRRRIAEHMLHSVQTAPHVTTVFEADLSAVLAHKARAASELRNLTLTAYFVAASALAMRVVPAVNSRWHADHLEIFHHVNIGVGTALGDKGLVVPVLRGVQDMNLYQIAGALEKITTRAREGTLAPRDVQGGTFTISNHGVSGSLLAAPIIINQPQSAILGVGKLEKRVIVREVGAQDCIQVRPMCYLTLTLDHRVLDAFQANRFLGAVVATLENWPLEGGAQLPAAG